MLLCLAMIYIFFFSIENTGVMPKPFLQSYLQILASLTSRMSHVLPLAAKIKADDDSDHDSDTEMDSKRQGISSDEIEVSSQNVCYYHLS